MVDGLVAIVSQQFNLDLFSKSIFLFCNKNKDRLKALIWDNNSSILLYERLEDSRFQGPKSPPEAILITLQQLRWLLKGLAIDQTKALQKQLYPMSVNPFLKMSKKSTVIPCKISTFLFSFSPIPIV